MAMNPPGCIAGTLRRMLDPPEGDDPEGVIVAVAAAVWLDLVRHMNENNRQSPPVPVSAEHAATNCGCDECTMRARAMAAVPDSVFAIGSHGRPAAVMASDGAWMVDWDEVLRVAVLQADGSPAVAAIAICRLLLAAKPALLLRPLPKVPVARIRPPGSITVH